MLEVIFKANMLLDIVKQGDQMQLLEMSINKHDVMLEKAKVLVIKLDSMFVVIPMSVTKIEVKTRNILLN